MHDGTFKNLKHIFELIQVEGQCRKVYFKFFLPQKAGAFGNNIGKKLQKPRPKLKKICNLYIYREYLLCLQSNSSGFLQKYISFAEQQLNFCHFKGSIIS